MRGPLLFYILSRAWKWGRKSQGSLSRLLIKVSRRKFPDHHQASPLPLSLWKKMPAPSPAWGQAVWSYPASRFTSLWLLRALSISPLAVSQSVEQTEKVYSIQEALLEDQLLCGALWVIRTKNQIIWFWEQAHQQCCMDGKTPLSALRAQKRKPST